MSEKSSAPAPQLSVEQIMTAEVRHLSPENTIREAISLLTENHISGAPVIDQMGKVISVCSEGDLLKLAASAGLDKKISTCLQKLPKLEKLITLKKTASFSEAYQIFLANPIHRILIVDGNGKLQGIVSRSNILRVLCSPKKIEA